jgi:hypothetical protein
MGGCICIIQQATVGESFSLSVSKTSRYYCHMLRALTVQEAMRFSGEYSKKTWQMPTSKATFARECLNVMYENLKY